MEKELITTTFRITREQAAFIKKESISATILVQAMIEEFRVNEKYREAVKKRGAALRAAQKVTKRGVVIDGIKYSKSDLSEALSLLNAKKEQTQQ
jgi:K+-transporting ATPase c subunit